ncbi:hypothetical protein ACFFON_11800 [Arthrobacter citreus]|uniref:hypothetical protein n=1 Tax=Arthrobacter TaxID=1663 RepID=UPI001264FDC9|nr:hypothetical protein [Arthrobacter gandavensis]
MNRNADSRTPGWNPTWAELPPARRKFWLWLVLLLFLIAPGARIPLEVLGVSPSAATLIVLGAALLVIFPLGRAAWLELRDSYATGKESPPQVTSRGVAGWVVSTVILWVVLFALTAWVGPEIPTVPVIVTVMAAQRWYQWRLQSPAE